jgi:hypothetical protein
MGKMGKKGSRVIGEVAKEREGSIIARLNKGGVVLDLVRFGVNVDVDDAPSRQGERVKERIPLACSHEVGDDFGGDLVGLQERAKA